MAKRGRKRIKRYFGPIEEEAVVLFLSSDDVNFRNEIYNKWLKLPFNKMVESIIRRYKLYRKTESYEDLHADTLSFLMMKSDKFEGARGKKAYSYYGTICKNYIMGLLIKDEKNIKQTYSYDDVYKSIESREDMIYYIDDDNTDLTDFISNIKDEISKKLMTDLSPDAKYKKTQLTENERRVGNALIDIFDNWGLLFDNLNGGNKFNKNTILSAIREATNLKTKDIRSGMRKYKELYYLLKNKRISNGLM